MTENLDMGKLDSIGNKSFHEFWAALEGQRFLCSQGEPGGDSMRDVLLASGCLPVPVTRLKAKLIQSER